MCSWMNEILYRYCESLSRKSDLKEEFLILHKLLEMRAATYVKMNRLLGRFDLIKSLAAAKRDDNPQTIPKVEDSSKSVQVPSESK